MRDTVPPRGNSSLPSSPVHGVLPVHSVERAFRILEALAEEDAGVSELARRTGFPKATAYRLVLTLARLGYVEELPNGSQYRLGLRLLELAARALGRVDFRHVARPYLVQLRDATRLTVHMGVLDGTEVVYVEKLDSPSNVRMASRVGTRNPVYCTALGKAILYALPDQERKSLLDRITLTARTPRTLTSVEALCADLAASRERGFAIDDVENEEGIRCIGAPTYGETGEVIGAISVSGPLFQIRESQTAEIGQKVAHVARLISRALGSRGLASGQEEME